MSDEKTNDRAKSPATAESALRLLLLCLFVTVLSALSGCSLPGQPRARMGHLPTATIGITFPDPNDLGRHSYGFNPFETAGIVYTCRAGHIDLSHIRGTADPTKYLHKKIIKTLEKGKEGFSFNLTGEMSTHVIEFTYPDNWESRKGKGKVIEEVALETAQYLAFNAMTWHEIQTWFGVHYAGFEPEFNSAFSWEDVYSNLLGAKLAAEAIQREDVDYDEALTEAIDKQLAELDVQPSETAKEASAKMKGKWYTGNFIPDMKMRNFDIGLDGSVTPTLVEDVEGCEGAKPLAMAVPTIEVLKKYGFEMYYEIKPNVFEQGKMFKAVSSDKIIPQIHFPIFIEYMKEQAERKGYKYLE